MNRAAKAGSASNARSISFLAMRRTTVRQRCRGGQSASLTVQTAFAEETASFQQCDDGLFTALADDGQLDPAVVNEEHGVRRVPLSENDVILVAFDEGFAGPDLRQELRGIKALVTHRNLRLVDHVDLEIDVWNRRVAAAAPCRPTGGGDRSDSTIREIHELDRFAASVQHLCSGKQHRGQLRSTRRQSSASRPASRRFFGRPSPAQSEQAYLSQRCRGPDRRSRVYLGGVRMLHCRKTSQGGCFNGS